MTEIYGLFDASDVEAPDRIYTSEAFARLFRTIMRDGRSLLCRLQARNGTQTNAMQHLTPESVFWHLVPGENIVTFSTPSGSVVVAIEYASRYTGV